jgi:hypothetical protein
MTWREVHRIPGLIEGVREVSHIFVLGEVLSSEDITK